MTYEQLDFVNCYTHRLLNRSSSFLQLPGELRNRIYEYVIADWIHRMARACNESAQLPLPLRFSICQQIRNEGVHVFYHKYMSVIFYMPLRYFTADEAAELSL
jgi:hypothetical protein